MEIMESTKVLLWKVKMCKYGKNKGEIMWSINGVNMDSIKGVIMI